MVVVQVSEVSKTPLPGGQGHLGLENRVGVSFIRAEAATEATVVLIDSISMSFISNESTRETSLQASTTVLKGVGVLLK